MSDRGYRTEPGDVLTHEHTGEQRTVIEVYRSEDLVRFQDWRAWLHRADEQTALTTGGGRRRGHGNGRE
jgi:hypothetical protein